MKSPNVKSHLSGTMHQSSPSTSSSSFLKSKQFSISTLSTASSASAKKMSPSNVSSNQSCTMMKQSVSMTSLPPNGGNHDISEMALAKLRLERPYNSLKKKRNSERDIWRHSWGSGHNSQSHSTCSLHSTATTTGAGSGIGKDDFWAAIQTNYNYIMDTNLLDSCKEARCEIEGAHITEIQSDSNCCEKINESISRAQGSYVCDIRSLRRWLREMENRISKAPTLTAAMKMKTGELQKRLRDHSDLYREIVSHDRIVGACIRASKANSQKPIENSETIKLSTTHSGEASTATITTITSSSSSSSRIASVRSPNKSSSLLLLPTVNSSSPSSASTSPSTTPPQQIPANPSTANLNGLVKRYHLLYLNAIEVQCLLEGLLNRKDSPALISRAPSDTDEEPVAKLARLDQFEHSIKISPNKLRNENSGEDYVDGIRSDDEWFNGYCNNNNLIESQATGFDADSEGSDCEIVPKSSISPSPPQQQSLSSSLNNVNLINHNNIINSESSELSIVTCCNKKLLNNSNTQMVVDPTMDTDPDCNGNSGPLFNPTILITQASTSSIVGAAIKTATDITTITTPPPTPLLSPQKFDTNSLLLLQNVNCNQSQNSNNNGCNNSNNELNQSSGKIRNTSGSGTKRTRHQTTVDISKFNRSNRKSNNCAIFYFKHLDTDNENNNNNNQGGDWSSQASQVFKSGASSEEDDEWFFSNGNNNNNTNNSNIIKNEDIEMNEEREESFNNQQSNITQVPVNHSNFNKSNFNNNNNKNNSNNNNNSYIFNSTQNKMETKMVNDDDVTKVEEINGNPILNSSNHLQQKRQQNQLQYSKETIQQLVLDAETLVRDEILLKTPTNQRNNFYPEFITSTVIRNKNNHHNTNTNNHNNSRSKNILPNKVMSNPKIKRVQEWLKYTPSELLVQSPPLLSAPTTDCEASGEYTESDSAARDSDTSEGITDSVATYLQDHSNSQSQCTSTEVIATSCGTGGNGTGSGSGYGGISSSTDHLTTPTKEKSNATLLNDLTIQQQKQYHHHHHHHNHQQSQCHHQNQNIILSKVQMRSRRRNSDRPWSVSCLSQLQQQNNKENQSNEQMNAQSGGLANHSISESALDTLSSPITRNGTNMQKNTTIGSGKTTSDSKSSLKRRRLRSRKRYSQNNGGIRKMEYSMTNGSDGNLELTRIINETLVKSESFSGQANLAQDLTMALSMLTIPSTNMNGTLPSSGLGVGGGSSSLSSLPPSSKQIIQKLNMNDITIKSSSNKNVLSTSENETDDENIMMKPHFQLGAYTTAFNNPQLNVSKLGSLAALANYNCLSDERSSNNDKELGTLGIDSAVKDLSLTGTDNSNVSEPTWDDYQEKYLSEAYSEGVDSDGARRLLDFGDDYRNFLDSQSDCCSSSISAANNLDSLSPPCIRRQLLVTPNSNKSSSKSPSCEPDSTTIRRRRAMNEYMYERRRKGSDNSARRHSDENRKSIDLTNGNISSSNILLTTNSTRYLSTTQKSPKTSKSNIYRKLETESINNGSGSGGGGGNCQSSLGSSNYRNNKYDDEHHQNQNQSRRRIRSYEKSLFASTGGSMSSSDSSASSNYSENEDDVEIKNLLMQSKSHLEQTEALRVRSHLLRPEDYIEIIARCRENVRCLESVLREPTCTILSATHLQDTKDLLSSWESLYRWSDNASVARQLQEDMTILKCVLNKLGNHSGTLDSESSIQFSIDELKNEKTQLHTHRSTMLRLNASVHSWLTRQEMKIEKLKTDKLQSIELQQQQLQQKQRTTITTVTTTRSTNNMNKDNDNDDVVTKTVEQHHTIENSIVDVPPSESVPSITENSSLTTVAVSSSTDDLLIHMNADEELHCLLKNEVGEMYRAWDEADHRITSHLECLTNSLIAWKQFESGLNEFKEALGKDKGALKGLTGALDFSTNGIIVTNDMAHDVKEVAKRLSEKIDIHNHAISIEHQQHYQQQLQQLQQHHQNQNDNLYLNPAIVALPFGLKSSSNGSLSDSGISDGGGSSDYGLSERERRLSTLRRLARQLENALAPGSAALNSITQRMEAAEADLRSLQDTCRELIVRTAAATQHQQQSTSTNEQYDGIHENETERNLTANVNNPKPNVHIPIIHLKGKTKKSPQSKRRINRRSIGTLPNTTAINGGYKTIEIKPSPLAAINDTTKLIPATCNGQKRKTQTTAPASVTLGTQVMTATDPDDDPDDYDVFNTDTIELDQNIGDDDAKKKNWLRRIAKYAIPIHIALVALICAACLLEPHCCDAFNNLSMSFTPQLRYVRGPPPI